MPASKFMPMGPGYLFAGDPGAANGMKMIEEVEDFNLDIGIRIAFGTTALTAGSPVSSSIFALPPNPTAQVRVNEFGLNNLSLLMSLMGGATTTTGTAPADKTAVGFGGATTQLVLPTVCFIPAFQKAAGVEAENAIWFPRAFFEGLNGIQFNRMSNQSANNPVTLTMKAAQGKTDAYLPTGNAIPEAYQFGWIGRPSALGLTYSAITIT